MQNPKDKKIISRYFSIIILMAVVGIIILIKAVSVMVFERSYWREVAERAVKDIVIAPRRGNILSDDGLLMATTVPQYTLFMDFKVSDTDEDRRRAAQYKRDTLLTNHMTEICEGLHSVLPDKSVAEFRRTFEKAAWLRRAIAVGRFTPSASPMLSIKRLPSCLSLPKI